MKKKENQVKKIKVIAKSGMKKVKGGGATVHLVPVDTPIVFSI